MRVQVQLTARLRNSDELDPSQLHLASLPLLFMAIHIVATLVSFSHPWRAYIPWAAVAVGLLWLRIWLAGRKCTWEREWRQRRVIVVVRPLFSFPSLSFSAFFFC